MDDIVVICDVCDEEIRKQEYEDTNDAVARHGQSEYHLEVEKRFRSIKLGTDTALSNGSVTPSGDVAEPYMPANVSNQAKSSNVFSCKLCQVEVADSFAMMSHIQSEKHAKTEGFVKNVNGQREMLQQVGFSFKQTFPAESKEILSCFSNMNSEGLRLCLVCFTRVPSDEYHLLGHVTLFEMHTKMLDALFISKGVDHSFRCIICDVSDIGETKFNEHRACAQHRSSIEWICKFTSEFLI